MSEGHVRFVLTLGLQLAAIGGIHVMMVMPIGAGLQEKLRKIEVLYAGAGTPGEQDAAEAALERLRARLAEQQASAPPVEIQFSLGDQLSRRLFLGNLSPKAV